MIVLIVTSEIEKCGAAPASVPPHGCHALRGMQTPATVEQPVRLQQYASCDAQQ
jgi:hypothetical protein